MKELTISDISQLSPNTVELVRIWMSDNKPTFVISGKMFKDTAAWGLIIMDLAKHISRAAAQSGQDEKHVFERIMAGFDAERK